MTKTTGDEWREKFGIQMNPPPLPHKPQPRGKRVAEQIAFTIPGVPVAQPRQRHAMIAGHVRNYTPTKHPVNAFKAVARLAASAAMKDGPIEGPLRVDLVFVFARPAAKVWKSKPMPRIRHTAKPDRDNLEKSVQDALNEIVWRDDAQICAGETEKWYAAGDEHPHVGITVTRIE